MRARKLPVFRIIAIAFFALVLGGCESFYVGSEWTCYEGKYKKPTDLSLIKVGASRTDIEKLLGKPLAQSRTENFFYPGYKTLAAYDYIGKPPKPREIVSWGLVHSACPPSKDVDLRRHMVLAYDNDDRVIGDDRLIRSEYPEVPPYGPHYLALTPEDYQLRAAIWNEKPKVTSASIAFIPTLRERDYWLCLNTYNRHAWALKEMGRRYWQGEKAPLRDKVVGLMWYILAT